jgi:hypothetical protein
MELGTSAGASAVVGFFEEHPYAIVMSEQKIKHLRSMDGSPRVQTSLYFFVLRFLCLRVFRFRFDSVR